MNISRIVLWGALLGGLGCFGCKSDDEKQPARDEPQPAAAPEAPPTPERTQETQGPPMRRDGTILGTSELMGTRVSINVYVGDAERTAAAGEAMNAALAEMARIEEIMSEWKESSDLSALNRSSGGEPLEVPPELIEVLARSKDISKATDGVFDVTFHGVGQLWSFRPGARPPERADVQARLALVDWTELEVDEQKNTARLAEKGMAVGLGAIAKGYAVDRASAVLVEAGFPNHVVEAGGDTYAAGTKGGRPWMVGVQDPDAPGALGAIPVSDKAVVTSGDYQRFFEFEGKRYAHILDPETGWPIETEKSAKSVTLVAPNATDADAYCTAVTVMGPDDGMAFVEKHDELEAVIITRDGEVRVSSGLADDFITTPDQP